MRPKPKPLVVITAADFVEDPVRVKRSEAPSPLRGKSNHAVRARWVSYRAAQRFRIRTLPEAGEGHDTFIASYEELAALLGLSLSTIRQYFAAGGGRFQHRLNDERIEVTRGRVGGNGA